MSAWSTPSDIRAKVRRRWDDGSLLRAFHYDQPFPVIDIPLRGPRPGEVGDDLEAVRQWAGELEAGSRGGRCYDLVRGSIGGRAIGRNEIPRRAMLTTYGQAWALLGTADLANRFREVAYEASEDSSMLEWVLEHQRQSIELADVWPQVKAAYAWLLTRRGSGLYLRQIDVPGVDTKFVETHRGMLARMLRVSAKAPEFAADLGLAGKPELVRLRVDPALELFGPLTDVTARVDELARLPIGVSSALIVENEITFLAVPVPPGGVVIWGRGFDVGQAGRLPWLRDADVGYWGDLDTHGFAILNRLRSHLPSARALMMDRATLVAFRDRWGTEPVPTRAQLPHLTAAEVKLYDDLVTDRFGDRVRLEQERIDWDWVLAALE